MLPEDLEEVYHLDRLAFGADRSFFIARRLARSLGFVERPDSPWRMAVGSQATWVIQY